MIPGKFEAWIAGDAAKELPCTERVEAEKDGDSWHLTAHGISGHASSPAGKINALGVLIDYILEQKLASPEEEKYLKIAVLPHHAYDGSLLGIAASDDCFSPLTVVSGLMFFRDGSIVESLDSRYPTSTSVEKIGEQLKKIAGDDVLVEHIHGSVPFYTAPESPVISACLEAYRFVTGDERKPYTIGGGTYARCFPRGAAFGPVHPDLEAHPELGAIHSANEGASEEGLLQTLKVYILALAALEKLDF